MSESRKSSRGQLRLWFALTPEERRFLAGILVLALIGLTARYLHLRAQRSGPYPAPQVPGPVEESR